MIKEITQHVENITTDLVLGETLYGGYRPAETAPDDCVVVLESTGGRPNFDLPDYLDKTIQIITRAVDYYTARAWAQEIYDALHGATGISLPVVDSGKSYYASTIEAVAAPYSIGTDDRGLHEISTNYIFRVQDA